MAYYDSIKLEKGLYTLGKSFTEALEEIDPSENYIGTELEGLDAYQRQLKRFGIKVNGKNSDCIDKFFKTSDSAALFPEYIARSVYQGIEEDDSLSKVISTVTNIEGLDYRSIAFPDDTDFVPKIITEGTFIPETQIKTKETLISLKKRGRSISASYEAIRFQRLDLFSIFLKQIGSSIAKAEYYDAIRAIIYGDGATPFEQVQKTQIDAITYNELLKFWADFSPFTLTTIICSPKNMTKFLAMSEFKDANAGFNFQATGKLVTPLGAELCKGLDEVTGEYTILGIDRRYALEKVQCGGVTTEFDKLIDRQIERAAITSIAGFSKICPKASKMLTIKED